MITTSSSNKNWQIQLFLSCLVAISLPLLIICPSVGKWIPILIALTGLLALIRERNFLTIDRDFLIICLIIPCFLLLNMLIKGWAPIYLERPGHLIIGWFIYYAIRQYGVHRNTLFYSACAATFFSFGIAIYEAIYLGNERVFGFNNGWNAVPFGNFSLLFGFFCLSGIFISHATKRQTILRTILGLSGFFCGIVASLLSGSRGGWIAFPFLILFCLFCFPKISKKFRLTIVILLAVATLTVWMSSSKVRNRIEIAAQQTINFINAPQNTESRETSVGIRLAMWQWGFEKFMENPLAGMGYATYQKEREKAVKSGALPEEFNRLANLHNEIISTLAFGGLIAMSALFTFWFLAWRFFYKKMKISLNDDDYFYAMCGLLTIWGTALFSMTEGLFGTSPGTKTFMLSLAIPAGFLCHSSLLNRPQIAD